MSEPASAPAGPVAPSRERRLRYPPLVRRVLLVNATVLAGASAVTVLALSPGIVSSEVALTELAILAGGLVAMLVLNLVLLRKALRPLEELRDFVRTVDPLQPGQRVPARGPASETTELAAGFNEMLERLEDERRESARLALEAQEAERLRVAQELHDEVGQSLTAVLLQLAQAQRRLPSGPAGDLAEARETARASLDDVRRIARRLRPEALDDLGLARAVDGLVARYGNDPSALVAAFPGSPHAATILAADVKGPTVGWRTWHAYPQTAELVETYTQAVIG